MSSRLTFLRIAALVLCAIALIAMFFKLLEAPSLFACSTCTSNNPYIPLAGSVYFSTLLSLALLFSSFPGPHLARGGLLASLVAAGGLTAIEWPILCPLCLVAHACNILMWGCWMAAPSEANLSSALPLRVRIYLSVFAPVSMLTLFSCLHLIHMIYSLKSNTEVAATNLKTGETVDLSNTESETFRRQLVEKMIINFVAADCPYCKKQLAVLNSIYGQLQEAGYKVLNISPSLPYDLVNLFPSAEWISDQKRIMKKKFKVRGYPTFFVLEKDGTILKIVAGIPDSAEVMEKPNQMKYQG